MTTTTMTPERLAELRRIAQAATPGPWEASENARVIEGQFDGEQTQILQMGGVRWPNPDNGKNERYYEQREANAAHIAAFDPPTILALLNELTETRARLAETEAALARERARGQRVAALLPKWGNSVVGFSQNSITYHVYSLCINDLSAALATPETPAEAAARLAEHREETRLDLMAAADGKD